MKVQKVMIWLSDILNIIIFGFLIVIFLLNISAVTVKHIENRDLKRAIQRKDATIQALLLTGRVDAFIVRTHPDQQEKGVVK